MICSLSSLDYQGDRGQSNPTCCLKIFKLFALSGSRNTKTSVTNPRTLALVPLPYYCQFTVTCLFLQLAQPVALSALAPQYVPNVWQHTVQRREAAAPSRAFVSTQFTYISIGRSKESGTHTHPPQPPPPNTHTTTTTGQILSFSCSSRQIILK